MKKKVTLRRLYHRERWRIAIFFSYDEKLKEVVKAIPGVSYSGTNKCFYVDDTEENLILILKTVKEAADVEISALFRKEEKPECAPKTVNALESTTTDTLGASVGEHKEEGKFKKDNCTVPPAVSNVEPREHPYKKSSSVAIVSAPAHPGSVSPVEFRISEREGLLVVKFTGRYD
ncbi:MAG: hypothetical protein GYA43_07420, partial [Bacteroidales bacterium]|nr:hypothetical protein [Bacteroidales bacterium]